MKDRHEAKAASDFLAQLWTDCNGLDASQAEQLANVEAALHGIATISKVLEENALELLDEDDGQPLSGYDEEGLRQAVKSLATFAHREVAEIRESRCRDQARAQGRAE